jgi:hypothetical protein
MDAVLRNRVALVDERRRSREIEHLSASPSGDSSIESHAYG